MFDTVTLWLKMKLILNTNFFVFMELYVLTIVQLLTSDMMKPFNLVSFYNQLSIQNFKALKKRLFSLFIGEMTFLR